MKRICRIFKAMLLKSDELLFGICMAMIILSFLHMLITVTVCLFD